MHSRRLWRRGEEKDMSEKRVSGTQRSRFLPARLGVGTALMAFVLAGVPQAHAGQWNPAAFAKEDTLKLRTVGPGEGEYWFPVWLVVVDGQAYVRLGTRAAGRVERNTAAPYLGVEVAGQRFDRVRGVPVPDHAEPVAKAMADKYTSDVLVRWFAHPLTLRLVPE
jgi:hypothetical protein